mmetsp:Transcript_5178/g.6682  ORF Transcript_5178/g.6682 Transcript_5178/m.6682 type:complete len:374 (-) Transcript_5178:26-1147(-)
MYSLCSKRALQSIKQIQKLYKTPTCTFSSTQIRNISILNSLLIDSPTNAQTRIDLNRAINLVQKYDPAGYLPGLLVSSEARIGYFAVRAFWIDSGLRFKESPFKHSITNSRQVSGIGQKDIEIPDKERLQKWKTGIESLYSGNSQEWENDATLRLLHHAMQQHTLSKKHFDRILLGREIDVASKQYTTVESLKDHVTMSCGSLLHLILECANIYQNDVKNDIIFEVATHVGITHGLSNALRLSVPKASSTGKVIIPQELCDKYGIKSPRYLLSALGMGDEECRNHLKSAVRDIVEIARQHLSTSRALHKDVLYHVHGQKAISTFLPALSSETFLNRLEEHHFDLTDRKLRQVGFGEHFSCSWKMITSSLNKSF